MIDSPALKVMLLFSRAPEREAAPRIPKNRRVAPALFHRLPTPLLPGLASVPFAHDPFIPSAGPCKEAIQGRSGFSRSENRTGAGRQRQRSLQGTDGGIGSSCAKGMEARRWGCRCPPPQFRNAELWPLASAMPATAMKRSGQYRGRSIRCRDHHFPQAMPVRVRD